MTPAPFLPFFLPFPNAASFLFIEVEFRSRYSQGLEKPDEAVTNRSWDRCWADIVDRTRNQLIAILGKVEKDLKLSV